MSGFANPTDNGQYLPIYRFLDSNGNGTGTKDMSTTADDYFISAPTGTAILLSRMIVHLSDGGPLNADNFGGLAGPLTTGITVGVETSGDVELLSLTDGVSVKANSDWARYCHDVSSINFGAGDDAISVRWTFRNSGQYLRLNAGNKLVMTVADDLSDLTSMYAVVQGFQIPYPQDLAPQLW